MKLQEWNGIKVGDRVLVSTWVDDFDFKEEVESIDVTDNKVRWQFKSGCSVGPEGNVRSAL